MRQEEEKKRSLAREIMTLAQQKIISSLRFMSSAVLELPLSEREKKGRPATDGQRIWYNAEAVMEDFKAEAALPVRELLHSCLHCLFGHPFVHQKQDGKLWDTACDLAVEEVVLSLDILDFALRDDGLRKEMLDRLRGDVDAFSAEKLYNFLVLHDKGPEFLERAAELFCLDDHSLFAERTARAKGKDPVSGRELFHDNDGEDDADPEDMRKIHGDEELFNKFRKRSAEETKKKWKRLSEKTEMDLELFHKKYGKRAGSFRQQIRPVVLEETDYGEFLRNFSVRQEIMHLSDEAFDLSYYMYGLKIYGNIPLIEALEYSDEKRISNFVIAIDTSGSVQGDIVQSFLQKTCEVLCQSGSFSRLVNIYLIQCDAEIQSVEHITDLEQLGELIPRLELRGFGGTDFRPVFEYVEAVRREQSIERIDGLLYFTDGAGIYPEKEPDYRTAFIFNRDDGISPKVPQWAIRAVLSSDTIRTLG